MIRVLTISVGFLAAVAWVDTCDASLAIRLHDGTAVVTVVDNGTGDNDSQLGVVAFNGSLGGTSPWTVNVTTGLGTPVIGTPALPNIDLNSVNVTSIGSGSLKIEVTQTHNGPSNGPIAFAFAAGGVTGGSFSATAYGDANNLPFATTTQLGSTLGPFIATGSMQPFSASTTGSAPGVSNSAPYSLTIKAMISHLRGREISSFDAELQAIPEPTSIAAWTLLGSMGWGLAWFGRRRAS